MSDRQPPYAAFRLNLEQQRKRAKELLRAAKATDATALQRLSRVGFAHSAGVKLAQAQHCIARELRFANWAALKRHISAMEQSRAALGDGIPDGDCRTMHIRCGDDIRRELEHAGFRGDYNVHANPYLQGPVTHASDWLEQRARFIADTLGPYLDLGYAAVLARCYDEERRLASASRDYPRVVLWLEHDRYDQFVLLRCLASFAELGAPPQLELVGPNDFPGATRFVGLGQLPAEALRLLWQRRVPISAAQMAFARLVWSAFRSSSPAELAELVHRGTPALPDLGAALLRHLQELPWKHDGLGLTHRLLLRALADHGPQAAGQLVGLVMSDYDPLPGLGDIGYDALLRELGACAEPLVLRGGAHAPDAWHLDQVALTGAGRAVLAGERDWLSFAPRNRWIGGVRISAGEPNWRWDEDTRNVVLH